MKKKNWIECRRSGSNQGGYNNSLHETTKKLVAYWFSTETLYIQYFKFYSEKGYDNQGEVGNNVELNLVAG